MRSTIVFIDDGFLSKLSKFFGDGKYLKLHRKDFSGLICENVFVYTAAPFQSANPNKFEIKRKEGYDVFKKSLINEGVIFREGRCQRLKIDGEFIYRQKAVDILLAMDLMNVRANYPEVERIILVSSDSDFVPVIEDIEKKGVKTILYTYFEKKRNTNFSRSNELVKSVYKYVKLNKEFLEGVENE